MEVQRRIPEVSVIEALTRLERSSPAPARLALERAKKIAGVIELCKSPAPFVFPTEIGGIQFEWHGGSRELDLEILPEETAPLAFLTLVDGECCREGEIKDNVQGELRRLLSWLAGSPGQGRARI